MGALLFPFQAQAPVTRHALADVSICDALALWSSWTCSIPFSGPTGSAACDMQLADAFRALLTLTTLDERLRWLEHQIWSPNDFPHPTAPADQYRATLMRWWLELYGEACGG